MTHIAAIPVLFDTGYLSVSLRYVCLYRDGSYACHLSSIMVNGVIIVLEGGLLQ